MSCEKVARDLIYIQLSGLQRPFVRVDAVERVAGELAAARKVIEDLIPYAVDHRKAAAIAFLERVGPDAPT